MIPGWLHALSVACLALGFLSAIWIVRNEFRARQHMWIMNIVWPVTALFGGLLIVALYLRHGKKGTQGRQYGDMGHGAKPMDGMPTASFPVTAAVGTTHCGAGCTLGDICAEWLAFALPGVAVWFGWTTLFHEKIFAVWILDFVFAYVFGIAFQYFTIKPMRGLTPLRGLVEAVKADTLSLTAWQIGMYGFMAIAHFWIFADLLGAPLAVNSAAFWFMMQIAMLCGFATSYPVNWWLIRVGVKEAM